MIHYTLLPEREIRSLKREYRTRLAIFLAFFLSCAILVGIGSLMPAYIYSYTEEKEVLKSLEELERDRQDRGTDVVMKELSAHGSLLRRLKDYGDPILFSQVVSQVISHKPQRLTLSSFQMSDVLKSATSTLTVILQGKAPTREELVTFESNLEADPLVASVELPVSNLAKSRDIAFSMKLSILKPQ